MHKRLLTVCISAALALGQAQPSLAVDFKQATAEATELLADYIKIDTTNPPGNELAGAKYLAKIFEDNGIKAEVIESTPGRACVYARLRGNGKQRPIILLNHIDVVPAKASDWRHPPFKGEIHNGELWGRGAVDMKGMGIAELEAMLLLKRSNCRLQRDIIFLATPDEEVGGTYGANWFVDHHPEIVAGAEFLLNEGFHIDTDNKGQARYWGVDVSEKSVLWLKLTARGQAGHASMPMRDSANNRLVRALNNIARSSPRPLVLPAIKEYFQKISKSESGWKRLAYANIDKAVQNPRILQQLLADKMKSSMFLNTISLTVMKSGYKTNVIPGEAVAELDCRLLPGVNHLKFIQDLKKNMRDDTIEISVLEWHEAGASDYKTKLFAAIKSVAAKDSPGVPVVPVIVPWFTDSHWFRKLGIVCYGFGPFNIDEAHLATMHGKDERIPVVVLGDGVRRTYQILEHMSCER